LNRICRQASEDSSTCEIRADSSCAVAGASPFVRPWPRHQRHIAEGERAALFVDDAQPRDSSPGLPVEHQQRLLPFAVNPAIAHCSSAVITVVRSLPIGVHRLLAETDAQKRREWIGTLDRVESLKPRIVIAKHKRPGTKTIRESSRRPGSTFAILTGWSKRPRRRGNFTTNADTASTAHERECSVDVGVCVQGIKQFSLVDSPNRVSNLTGVSESEFGSIIAYPAVTFRLTDTRIRLAKTAPVHPLCARWLLS